MRYIAAVFVLLVFTSCIDNNPNKNFDTLVEDRNDRITSIQLENESMHTIYIPIYSSIYNGSKGEKVSLTATLSMRNTSERDTLFIGRVEYYNTQGDLVRNYVEQPIYLKPLETLEYVINQNDNTGGSGANFIIDWYGDETLNPVFQGVMIGGLASRTFSFTTESYEIQ